jgi:hypothetical protein
VPWLSVLLIKLDELTAVGGLLQAKQSAKEAQYDVNRTDEK